MQSFLAEKLSLNHGLIESCLTGIGYLRESLDESLEATNFTHGELKDMLGEIRDHLVFLRNSSSSDGLGDYKPTLSAMTALLKEILVVLVYIYFSRYCNLIPFLIEM